MDVLKLKIRFRLSIVGVVTSTVTLIASARCGTTVPWEWLL